MDTGSLRQGDGDLLLAVLDAARHDDPGPLVPWALLDGLQRVVPCDRDVSYHRHDHRRVQSLLLQSVTADGAHEFVPTGPDGPDDPWWRQWWSSIDSPRPRPCDVRVVVVPVPAPPGESRRFLFVRSSGRPFDARDRGVLELLRPHLHEVWLDAERRRAGVPALSPREWEVLALVGAELSTADIAAELWISAGTVRKHMEHIRGKLGVHTITAAAVRALPQAPALPGLRRDG